MNVGQIVTWRSHSSGTDKQKIGIIVAIVKPGQNPYLIDQFNYEIYQKVDNRNVSKRDHESYLVAVTTGKSKWAKKRLYWPRVSMLFEVEQLPKQWDGELNSVETDYHSIDKSYGTKGRNVYTCTNRHHILTTHLATGVTPMFVICPECKERSASHGYNVSQKGQLRGSLGIIVPHQTEYWVRPSLKQTVMLSEMGYSQLVEHITRGGLIWKSELNGIFQKGTELR